MDLFGDIFSSSDSDSDEFEGFEADEVEAARTRLNGVSYEGFFPDSEDGLEEMEDETQQWSQNASPVEEPEFIPFGGPKNRPESDSELCFFSLLFTDDVLDCIVEQTNLYADQENAGKAKKDPDWFDSNGEPNSITVEELKAFLGVMIMMGLVKLPHIRDYWSEDEPFFFQPEIAKVFPRNRFLAIARYLHLNDNTNMPAQNDPAHKLFRVKPLVERLENNFMNCFKNYFPDSRFLSIDEAMIKYKGRLSFIQYMPMKPVKRGIKVYCLCEATTGFLVKFDIYVGKTNSAGNSTENIVYNLLDSFQGRNFYTFMDNWFSSINLFTKLEERGIRACGTLRMNRKGFPQFLKNANLQSQGDSAFAQKGNMVLSCWRDKAKNKLVTVVSTMYNAEGDDTVKRRKKGPDGRMQDIEINRPPNITQYCKYMGGVDLSDQNRSYYPVQSRRNIKWWKYIFYFLLDISIVNSWVLMDAVLGKKTEHLDFRRYLAKQLIGRFTARKRVGRPRIQPVLASVDHSYVELLPKGKLKQCKVCQRKRKLEKAANRPPKRPKETRFGCRRCNVCLCKGDCFTQWHTQTVQNEV